VRRDANAEQGFGDAQEDVTDAEGALFPIFVVSMLGTFLIPATGERGDEDGTRERRGEGRRGELEEADADDIDGD